MSPRQRLRIGTRTSRLALWQADFVRDRLTEAWPDCPVELVPIKTTGDKILDSPLSQFVDKGVFTREIEQALLDKQVDLAVHSLKDLPTELPDGLTLGAIPPRGPAGDAFSSTRWASLDELPAGARIGTSSLRRQAQLLAWRRDLAIESIRGNVETRLAKIDSQGLDGVILAIAGLKRLGLAERITQPVPTDIMLPAVGQGALAIEIRSHDPDVAASVAVLDDPATRAATAAERALLEALGGGCQVPIGALAEPQGDRLNLAATVVSPDGRQRVRNADTGPPAEADALGKRLAGTLLAAGARAILDRLPRPDAPDAPDAP